MNDFYRFRGKIGELIKAWNEIIKPGIEESGQYGETNTRKYLIDPILEALNWVDDGSKKIVDNEFSIKHKTGTGSADYALKINGIPKILIEAKDVAKVKDLENGYDLVHGIKRTYPRQLSDYCHDLNHLGFDIKFAVLTNGKEWIIYNLQYADISSEREVVFRLDLEELDQPNNLQKLWAFEYNDFKDGYTTLREIIQQLHDYRLDIDKKAVQQLLECKDLLSSSILNDYEKDKRGIKSQIDNLLSDKEKDDGMPTFQEILEEERLNFFIKEASSNIINKVLFIRILEDKNFLTPVLTKRSVETWKDLFGYRDYDEIMELFRKACGNTEKKYNGGLFRLNPYDKVEYDPDIIKKIIDILGDINFKEIDSDIIGRIYEIYLGHILKVEAEIRGKKKTKYKADNKERKKLGQYYTPKFVVDFIVKNTLGKLIEGKKPEEVAKIRILDPACGSGSFLINAYDTLVRYYENWNEVVLKKIEEANKTGGAKLSRYQDNGSVPNYKNIILKENVHGVDLNGLSVQIAEINLWIRALERDKKLIKLNKNILHGNSLVTGVEGDEKLAHYKAGLEEIKQRTNEIKDFYDKDELDYGEKNKLKALEARLKVLKEKINVRLNENLKGYFGEHFNKIHAFNWEVEFPQIMQEGGFDVVIGNPPYVNIFNMEEEDRTFFQAFFLTATNKSDLYAFFLENATNKFLKEGGHLGFIVSNTWTSIQSFKNLRKLMLEKTRILKIVPMRFGTFEDANVVPIVIIIQKCSDKEKIRKNGIELYKYEEGKFILDKKVKQNLFYDNPNYVFNLDWNPDIGQIFSKIQKDTIPLGSIAKFSLGIKTSNNARFIKTNKENDKCKKLLKGEDISRYKIDYKSIWIYYDPKEMMEKVGAGPRNPENFEVDKKIVLQEISGEKIIAALDIEKFYSVDTTNLIYETKIQMEYILGLLNSKLINFWYGSQYKGVHVKLNELAQIPIKETTEINRKKISSMVYKISYLNKKLQEIYGFFNKSLSNQPIKDTKSCKFGHYFDNYEFYGMERETSGRINEIKAKILSLDVKEEDNKLVIYMTNFNEEQKQLWKNIKAITLTIRNENVRKFLFFSIKGYINGKEGRGFGKGNLLELIKKIEVPVYVANVKMNTNKIRAVMKEFNHNTKDLWFKDGLKKEKFNSLTEMEAEIRKTDKEIDEMVYQLYGITEKEKKIIEKSLK